MGKNKNSGFTLLELTIAVLIIAIIASIGFIQFKKTIEKSRTSEAKKILGTIRTAEHGYKQEFGGFTSDIADLGIEDFAPSCVVGGDYYFSYSVDASGTTVTATRCTGTQGKDPGWENAYTITLNFDTGSWSGSNAMFTGAP